jgi:anti-sigma factor RsiW
MADIIPLSGDRHRDTLELLPWYVSGAIEPADRAKVEVHLAHCADCRAELAVERSLHGQVSRLPLDAALGFAELRRQLKLPPFASPHRRPMAIDALHRALPRAGQKNWAIAAQAAAVLLVVAIAVPSLQQREQPPAPYRTLGSVPEHAAGNLVVMFRAETSEAQLRAVLLQSGARVVDGPTVTGAYMLDVAASKRNSVLAWLRAHPAVTLAQPIDASPQ